MANTMHTTMFEVWPSWGYFWERISHRKMPNDHTSEAGLNWPSRVSGAIHGCSRKRLSRLKVCYIIRRLGVLDPKWVERGKSLRGVWGIVCWFYLVAWLRLKLNWGAKNFRITIINLTGNLLYYTYSTYFLSGHLEVQKSDRRRLKCLRSCPLQNLHVEASWNSWSTSTHKQGCSSIRTTMDLVEGRVDG